MSCFFFHLSFLISLAKSQKVNSAQSQLIGTRSVLTYCLGFNCLFVCLFVCFLKDHVANDCQSFAIDCTLCDKKGIPRGKLKDHQDAEFGDCEGTKAACPFGLLGCEAREVMCKDQTAFSIFFFFQVLVL